MSRVSKALSKGGRAASVFSAKARPANQTEVGRSTESLHIKLPLMAPIAHESFRTIVKLSCKMRECTKADYYPKS